MACRPVVSVVDGPVGGWDRGCPVWSRRDASVPQGLQMGKWRLVVVRDPVRVAGLAGLPQRGQVGVKWLQPLPRHCRSLRTRRPRTPAWWGCSRLSGADLPRLPPRVRTPDCGRSSAPHDRRLDDIPDSCDAATRGVHPQLRRAIAGLYAQVRADVIDHPNYRLDVFLERLDRHGLEPGFAAVIAHGPDGAAVGYAYGNTVVPGTGGGSGSTHQVRRKSSLVGMLWRSRR